MGEVYLTWQDICEAYDGEWVLVVRPPPDERTEVLGGWVIAHSSSSSELDFVWEFLWNIQELVLTEASVARAQELEDYIANWDYLLWRAPFVDGEIVWYENPSPSVVRPAKRWWQLWR